MVMNLGIKMESLSNMIKRKIYPDGNESWYQDNELHRENGPAMIHPDGTEYWYRKNDKLHRENGPAVISPDGVEFWYRDNKNHRENGPAIIDSHLGIGMESS